MTIGPELQTRILRCYHVEKWRVNTIAVQLGVHHGTVQRVLVQAGLPMPEATQRASSLDPYVPFLLQTLQRYPKLIAAALYAMVTERGYRGSASNFRYRISLLRPRPAAEAYLRLRTLPGEQAQCDWGHFGHLTIGRARRPLMAFVMVLSYSRAIYLRFFVEARLGSFLCGHTEAFSAWGGCPRVILYDNLKSAVLERQGDAIRFSPQLLALAAHYRFEPRPVAVARGNEKGRVERAIRYIREAFFAARSFADLADLNAQATRWCLGPARARPCPEERQLTVAAAFAQEQPLLLALPDEALPVHEIIAVRVGKTPYVRFDRNDYSVPHEHVRRELTVLAETDRIRILDGVQVIATHQRSYDRDAQIETPEHLAALVAHKRGARAHRTTDALVRAVPQIREFLTRSGAQGHSLGWTTAALHRLLEQYGADDLRLAVAEVLERGQPHQNAVRFALERRRHERGLAPVSVVQLPEHLRQRDVTVIVPRLDAYDRLTETAGQDSDCHENHDHGQNDRDDDGNGNGNDDHAGAHST